MGVFNSLTKSFKYRLYVNTLTWEEDLKANIKEFLESAERDFIEGRNLRLGKKEALLFKENAKKIEQLFKEKT